MNANLLARGVAKNEDSSLIKWFLDSKASEPGVGCFESDGYLIYTRREENVIVAIYQPNGAIKRSSHPDTNEGPHE